MGLFSKRTETTDDVLDLRSEDEQRAEEQRTETIGEHMRRTGATDARPGETIGQHARRTRK